MKRSHTAVIGFVLLFGCKGSADKDATANADNPVPAVMGYSISNIYPHNTASYTEGLEWHDNSLYESTGNKGQSKLAKIALETGNDIQKIDLPASYFGEGITVFNGKIYQLTYEEEKCFVYDFKTLRKTGEFAYKGQGWGMTNDGTYLIMNDGSNTLYYRDPATFQVVKTVGVFDNNGPLAMLNEMEYVDGVIYANVWLTNYIVKIDPASGKVLGRADFSYVLNKYAPGQVSDADVERGAVLNGIAYDSIGKRFFITGKNWPKVFEVKFN